MKNKEWKSESRINTSYLPDNNVFFWLFSWHYDLTTTDPIQNTNDNQIEGLPELSINSNNKIDTLKCQWLSSYQWIGVFKHKGKFDSESLINNPNLPNSLKFNDLYIYICQSCNKKII